MPLATKDLVFSFWKNVLPLGQLTIPDFSTGVYIPDLFRVPLSFTLLVANIPGPNFILVPGFHQKKQTLTLVDSK